jgi:hypothetical protein
MINIGDKVRVKDTGHVSIVRTYQTDGTYPYILEDKDADKVNFYASNELEVLESKVRNSETKKQTITMKITNLVKKLVDADTQALIKAGYLNGDLELTSQGRAELETIAFTANKEALVALAKEKVAEESK